MGNSNSFVSKFREHCQKAKTTFSCDCSKNQFVISSFVEDAGSASIEMMGCRKGKIE